MTHKTKGIVLRTLKYGETSLVVTVFTELFGIQTYMVNGVRTAKKSGNKAAMLQPAALLDMEVYHNEFKSMHRIKEFSWAQLYTGILSNVIKNSIALYMVELLQKSLKQPEQQTELFYFCEAALIDLDKAEPAVTANFPLYFALQLTQFLGFNPIDDNAAIKLNPGSIFLDLSEGDFVAEAPTHNYFLQGEDALVTLAVLKMKSPAELNSLKLNQQKRRALLLSYETYYALHIADFGKMKTLQVLQDMLS